jgi:hypothetical protein
MKKQHGISAPPRQPIPTLSSRNRGRPKKPAPAASAAGAAHHGMDVGASGEEGGWGGPHHGHDPAGGYGGAGAGHGGQMGPHKELSARPVGQVIRFGG